MTILQKMLFFVPKVPKPGWANICPLTAWGCRECDCLRVKLMTLTFEKKMMIPIRDSLRIKITA